MSRFSVRLLGTEMVEMIRSWPKEGLKLSCQFCCGTPSSFSTSAFRPKARSSPVSFRITTSNS